MASNSKRDRAVGAGSWLVAVATVLFGLLAVTKQASSADLSPGPNPHPLLRRQATIGTASISVLRRAALGTDTTTASGGGVGAAAMLTFQDLLAAPKSE